MTISSLSKELFISPTIHADGGVIRFGLAELNVAPVRVLRCAGDASGLEYEFTVVQVEGGDGLRIASCLRNTGKAPLSLGRVELLTGQLPVKLNRALANGRDMNGQTDLLAIGDTRILSSCVGGFASSEGGESLVIGWEDPTNVFCWTECLQQDGIARVAAWIDREGIALEPGAAVEFPPLLLLAGTSLWEGMRRYATLSARLRGGRFAKPVKTGWCSWYTYYGRETEQDILQNAATIAGSGIAGCIDTIQIDDGWNLPTPGAPRVWGDWYPGAKFPRGMKAIANDIKSHGYNPGIWLAPFSVDEASNLRRERPDLLVQGTDGQPLPFWGVYGLDLTNPEALEFVRETFDRVFNEWGYKYIKIDFLLHAMQPGIRKDPRVTTAEALRRGLQVIRDVAGDRFILGCGCAMGPALGIVDAMRIGPDVSHRWYLPMNVPEWPVGNCSIYSGGVHVIWRHWTHGLWWQNDPDCVLTHDRATEGEIAEFSHIADGIFATDPPMGLSTEEANFWSRLIWFSGGMGMLGENLKDLNEERLRLAESAFPTIDAQTCWIGCLDNPRLVAMATEQAPFLLATFNMTDEPAAFTIKRDSMGPLNHVSRFESMDDEPAVVGNGDLRFPPQPARSARIWRAVE